MKLQKYIWYRESSPLCLTVDSEIQFSGFQGENFVYRTRKNTCDVVMQSAFRDTLRSIHDQLCRKVKTWNLVGVSVSFVIAWRQQYKTPNNLILSHVLNRKLKNCWHLVARAVSIIRVKNEFGKVAGYLKWGFPIEFSENQIWNTPRGTLCNHSNY